MTEFELFDAADEPAATDDFDNAELVHWASHGQHTDPDPDPGPADEMSATRDQEDAQTPAPTRDGHSSNWIRVQSPWNAHDVSPYVTE